MRAKILRSEAVRIVLYCTVASVIFGWAHDAVTANVWVDYFTVHHPKLVDSQSPWVMAFLWGVLATFWVGGFGGLMIACCSFVGALPPPSVEMVQKWIRNGIVIVFACSMTCLFGCWFVFERLVPVKEVADREIKIRAVAVALTHQFSYTAATVLILVICANLIRWRFRSATMKA